MEPKRRRSWLLLWEWITEPAQINKRALKRAWVMRWKNVNMGAAKASLIIIIPSWLRVERAIIFFMSFSTIAARPAIRVVVVEIIRR